MNETSNIAIILPVYQLDEITKTLFDKAVKSIEDQKTLPNELILVVGKDDTLSLDYIKSFDFGTIKNIVKVIENDGDTSFASQFNLGVKESTSEWVSLLEQDDEMSNVWVKNVVTYRNAYPEVDLFLPIIVDTDQNNSFLSFTNEATWANSFSDKLGFLDNNALEAYQNFNIDGMVVKKSTYLEYGGIKKNIKLTFGYEFLLRMTLKDVKVMTLPRFGYKHTNQREGGLFHSYSQTMNAVEARWWLDKAKKEQHFKMDREITYDSTVA